MGLGALFGVATGLLHCRCFGVPEYVCGVNKLRLNVSLKTWIWRHSVA